METPIIWKCKQNHPLYEGQGRLKSSNYANLPPRPQLIMIYARYKVSSYEYKKSSNSRLIYMPNF